MTMDVEARSPGRWSAPVLRAMLAVAGVTALAPSSAVAQHDYYNTDAGRPLQTQDAVAIEYRGFEFLPAPMRMERTRGLYSWNMEPELAYGVLPRTQIGVGVPLVMLERPGGGSARFGLAGVHVDALHQLNVESSTLPAFALAGSALLPAGEFAPDDAYASVTGIATRTFSWGRLHLNGERTFGPSLEPGGAVHADLSRWSAGIAADRAFPLRAFLLGVEVVADQPLNDTEPVQWTAGTGVRYQLDVYWVLDAGIAHRFTGDHRSWSLTLGVGRAFGIPRFRY